MTESMAVRGQSGMQGSSSQDRHSISSLHSYKRGRMEPEIGRAKHVIQQDLIRDSLLLLWPAGKDAITLNQSPCSTQTLKLEEVRLQCAGQQCKRSRRTRRFSWHFNQEERHDTLLIFHDIQSNLLAEDIGNERMITYVDNLYDDLRCLHYLSYRFRAFDLDP